MTPTATAITGRFGEREGPAVRLQVGDAIADVLPFVGFNCIRWDLDGLPVLYAEPPGTANPSPTRSGHPILFPFPGRLRNGRLRFNGREYQLPLNDSTKTHAIHGFTPRYLWRVTGIGTESDSAFVTGEFHLSRELPDARNLWPADFVLTVTYRLLPSALKVDAVVTNPDYRPLPFGLGYHPYFAPPTKPAVEGKQIDDCTLRIASKRVWESVELLPDGRVTPVPDALDFTSLRKIGPTGFDHVFTDLTDLGTCSPLRTLALLSAPSEGRTLSVRAEAAFRELVLFTPPHRQAIAIEPYTCAADAANLEDRKVSAGWRVLPAGGRFTAAVEYWVGG